MTLAPFSATEAPTPVERLVHLVRLPYWMGCAFLALVVNSMTGLLDAYLQTFDLARTAELWLLGWQDLGVLVFLAQYFYLLYAPHYLRMKQLQGERSISAILPNREKDFHSLFSPASARLQIAVALALLILTVVSIQGARPGPAAHVILNVVVFFPIVVGLSSLVATYYSSLRGIHRIGATRLQLLPYYADRLLGLKPIGSLALSSALTYFVFVGLELLLSIFSVTQLSLLVFNFMLIVLGLGAFFLPLRRIHKVMVERKKREKEILLQQITPIFENSDKASPDVGQLLRLDMMKREISSIAVWPLDVAILAKLTVIVLSIIAALLARYIAGLLGI